jgi:hypothetical protein
MTVEENLQLMITLDDAWNSQDWDTFKKRHAEETAVYWPGQRSRQEEEKRIMKRLYDFLKCFRTTM